MLQVIHFKHSISKWNTVPGLREVFLASPYKNETETSLTNAAQCTWDLNYCAFTAPVDATDYKALDEFWFIDFIFA